MKEIKIALKYEENIFATEPCRIINMMKRTNKEIKRRSKLVVAFSNQKSVLRLIISILIDVNENRIKLIGI